MRLEAFAGVWDVEREIDDTRAGRRGRFTGSATFTPDDAGLAYREAGLLRLPDLPAMRAERSYAWRAAADGSIEVRFPDGRFFHSFSAGEPQPAAVHDCPPDRYEVRYDFTAWPCWRAEWRVRGPRKDYEMVSWFRPAGADA